MMAVPKQDEELPASRKAVIFSALLAFLALVTFSAAAGMLGGLLSDTTGWGRGNWIATFSIAVLVLIGVGAVWGVLRLRPWAGTSGPVSPSTRKTNNLFALSGLAAVPGAIALVYGTVSLDDPFGFFSNSPLTPLIAIAAIVSWAVSMLIGWWWYFAADEHEQEASDVGLLLGGAFFTTVTPAWWLATRAGLAPEPNAMILWIATSLIWGVGWFWRRYA